MDIKQTKVVRIVNILHSVVYVVKICYNLCIYSILAPQKFFARGFYDFKMV